MGEGMPHESATSALQVQVIQVQQSGAQGI